MQITEEEKKRTIQEEMVSHGVNLTLDLPSGNQAHGSVGPMIGTKMVAQIAFREEPTEDDLSRVNEAISALVGCPPKVFEKCDSKEESNKLARAFLGGGMG